MKFLYQESSLVFNEKIAEHCDVLGSYIKQLRDVAENREYYAPESFMNLPCDERIYSEIASLRDKLYNPDLRYIVAIGIGGSCNGARAVYDAMFGYFDVLEPARFPKILFVDTNNPEYMRRMRSFLKRAVSDPNEIVVNIISKSGNTVETVANTEVITELFRAKFGDVFYERIVVTSAGKSVLNRMARDLGIATLSIPASLSGRYSVFSSVGLFPLAMCGFDIKELCEGACAIRDICLSSEEHANTAAISASILFSHYKDGKSISDNFFFHPELESLGKWYRQLMGESIGKNGSGITPTVSIGSTDLHSMGQLYLGGPSDKITTFIYSDGGDGSPSVPPERLFTSLAKHISGKKFSEIMSSIRIGTTAVYKKKNLPYTEIALDGVSLRSLGEFMQFKMFEMIYLAKLMNVNAFDQPNVDEYKTVARLVL